MFEDVLVIVVLGYFGFLYFSSVGLGVIIGIEGVGFGVGCVIVVIE